jgi:hypothetical protein
LVSGCCATCSDKSASSSAIWAGRTDVLGDLGRTAVTPGEARVIMADCSSISKDPHTPVEQQTGNPLRPDGSPKSNDPRQGTSQKGIS